MNRRKFLQATVGSGLLLPGARTLASVLVPQIPLLGNTLQKYADPLPVHFGSRITGSAITASVEEFQQRVLPSSFAYPPPFRGTYVWGYKLTSGGVTRGPLYPAATIEARRGVATNILYLNRLPIPPFLQKRLTVDQTIHWADPLNLPMDDPQRRLPYGGPLPVVTHLHGAEVSSASDGHPDAWFTPNGIHGIGYRTLPGAPPHGALYSYPNRQEATTLWFHDHALGMTRLNVFAGLAGMYLLRDPLSLDNGLQIPFGLPAGPFEVEMLIQDRQFDTNGQWLFPDGNPEGLNGPPPNPEIHPFWNPEFFGDVIVVNGKAWPYLEVEPRRYRFRFVNGSNARFYQMRLAEQGSGAPGPPLWVIGTDGGLLDRAVKVADPAQPSDPGLVIGVAERYDVIVDFARYSGQTFILTNTANAPFPGGDPPDPETNGQIMQFRVTRPLSKPDLSYNPALGLPLRVPMIRLANPATGAVAPRVVVDRTRQLVLVEVEGAGGPDEVLLNNTHWNGRIEVNGLPMGDPIPDSTPNAQDEFATELPRVGSTEIWEILNITDDAHPIHIHLIQFQLLNRQDINADAYRLEYEARFPGGAFLPGSGPPRPYQETAKWGGNPDVTPYLQSSPAPPQPIEAGWKDTTIMFPGQVTRVIVRWAPQGAPLGQSRPGVNLFSFDPAAGPGYVWHCHILDHEDNEMMRPYTVAR